MEFRGHFLLNILVEIFWLLTGVFVLEMFFLQTQNLAGWSKGEVFMIYAFWRLISGFNAFFFVRNIEHFSSLVNVGELDFILTKPVGAIFLTTTRLVKLSGLSQIVLGLVLVFYATTISHFNWSVGRIVIAAIMVAAGILVKHSIQLISTTPVIWLQKIENIRDLQITLFAPARFPAEIYPRLLRFILIFIIPVSLAAAIPTAVIIGKLNQPTAILVVFASLSLYVLAYKFFYFALRHYSSASS